jgi:hypothetical protein
MLICGSFVAALVTRSPACGAVAAVVPRVAVSATPEPSASPAAGGNDTSDPCGGPGTLLETIDRPTVGFSTCAVKKSTVVLEEGYENSSQGGSTASVTASFPNGFERVGVAERFELDLSGPNVNRMRSGTSVTNGLSDIGLGFKYELPPRGRFTYAFDGLFTAATGSGGFGNGGPAQTLDGDVSYTLSPAINIGTTLSASSTVGSTNGSAGSVTTARYGTFDPSLVVTVQVPNEYQFFAEVAGMTKTAPQAGGRSSTDFGVQKLVGRNVELDLEYGIDFTPVNGSRRRSVGTGFGLLVD